MGALLAGSVMIPMYNVNAAETPTITYQAHVEDHGWMKEVSTSNKDAFAGTQAEARRMEALKIKLEGLDDVTLRYTVHIEDKGDTDFTSKDEVIGTTGEAKRLEGITVYADGLEDTDYALQYRVHIENEGTSEWVNAGEFAGSKGKAQRLESIQFRLVSALDAAKENAIAELKEAFPASKYTIHADKYKEVLEAAIESINDVDDVKRLSTALQNAKDSFTPVYTDGKLTAGVVSDEEELKNLSAEAATKVSNFTKEIQALVAKSTTNEMKNVLYDIQREGIETISSATNTSDVETKYNSVVSKAIRALKSAANESVNALYKSGKDDNGTQKYIADRSGYDTAIAAVKDNTLAIASGSDPKKGAEAVIYAYESAVSTLVEIDDIQDDAKAKFATELEKLGYEDNSGTLEWKATGAAITDPDEREQIEELQGDYYTQIENETNRKKVEGLADTAIEALISKTKEIIQERLDKKYNNGKQYVVGSGASAKTFVMKGKSYEKYDKKLEKAKTIDALLDGTYPTNVDAADTTGTDFIELTTALSAAKTAYDNAAADCLSGKSTSSIKNDFVKELNDVTAPNSNDPKTTISEITEKYLSKLANQEKSYWKNLLSNRMNKEVSIKISGTEYKFFVTADTSYETLMSVLDDEDTSVSDVKTAITNYKNANVA